MLTPLRPPTGAPLYEERMKQFRRDCADKRANPRNWGPARPPAFLPPEPAGSVRGRSGKKP